METPIRFVDVMIFETTLCTVPGRTAAFGVPSVGRRAADGVYDPREFQPGEKVTIQIPIPPSCAKGSEPVGILVGVGRPGPREWSSTPSIRAETSLDLTQELFFRVFERLRAEASHP